MLFIKRFLFAILTLFLSLGYLYANNSSAVNSTFPKLNNKKEYLFLKIYKGEPLSEIKKLYPSSFYLEEKEKNLLLNLFSLNFLKNMNFFKINNNIVLILNPKHNDRVIAVFIYSKNNSQFIENKMKKIVEKDKMIFKNAYVYYTNTIGYDKKRFKKELNLHNYLIDITTNLISSKKGLLYLNENYENQEKKGVLFAKIETFKLKTNCKICAYLGNKNIEHKTISGLLIYKRN